MKIVVAPGSTEQVTAAVDDYLAGRLGPEIAADAVRYCPKRTGALADSIEHHLEDHRLIVSATGSTERDYAVYVELGHRVYHPSTRTVGPNVVPPQPFLRAALYTERT